MSDDLKPEGIRNLLLGPMTLLNEIKGALIPGVLFCLLLLVKHTPVAVNALGWDGFGYKTKIACGILIAFVIGRAFCIPLNGLETKLVTFGDIKAFDPKKTSGTLWERLSPEAKSLVGGIVGVEFVKGATAWEHYNVASAETGFRLSTGAVLLVGSFIPGDGALRWAELGVGILFLIAGIAGARAQAKLLLAFVGRMGFDAFVKANEEQRKTFLPIIQAIFLSNTSNPPANTATETKQGATPAQNTNAGVVAASASDNKA